MTEFEQLQFLISNLNGFARVRILDEIKVKDNILPIYSFVFGSEDPTAPTLGLFGGVHGLERVGTQVVLNYLNSLVEQLKWDRHLRNEFKNIRLVSIPIVNPGGMFLNSRSNPQGVDIMRNAPIEGHGDLKPLVSGHRISRKLPWYRGSLGEPMEPETLALINFVKIELLPSVFSMAIDVHSGFGMQDRFWYPYSRSQEKFAYLSEVEKIEALLDKSLPYHIYKVEPQSESYIIHGDPWDYLFDCHRADQARAHRHFLPWCLEMGSWSWLKKNPKQLFLKGGVFNPILPHRYGRIMRRHKPLIDFMFRLVMNHNEWMRNNL